MSGRCSAPILKYPGAKWRIADWIIGYMPPHESYVEPYAGSLAVLLNKQPARIETVNDLDGEIVNFFRVCREQPEELGRLIALTPWAREEYERSFVGAAASDIERARRLAIQCWMTFGAGNTGQRGWRHSTGKGANGGPDNPKLWQRLPCVIAETARRLARVQIEQRPALDVIKSFNGNGVLLYVDPPYVMDTRTARSAQYNHEMTDNDHAALLDALNAHEGMAMLSGYDCEMYRDMLCGWECVTINTTAESGKRRTECLWLNRAVWEQQLGVARLDEM